MSLTQYPSDIISFISSCLDNNSGYNLMRTCRLFKLHGDQYGFKTSINLDYSMDAIVFIKNFMKHKDSLRIITVRGIDNPHIWIPQYVETLIFDHCSVIERINPGNTIHAVKSIKIRDYHRFKNNNTLRINWTQFPNLEHLELYVYDVDLNGLNLNKLKTYNIDSFVTRKKKRKISD